MKAYLIQQPETKTNYYTTDFMDIWNQLEKSELPVIIQPFEVSVAEYHDLVKNNANGPEKLD